MITENWNEREKSQDGKEWDVFISHASEDKEEFVRPLAEALQRCGVRVWYDEFELKTGDSLLDSIDKGLKNLKFGIIVCSPCFFEKNWANYELKSLLIRQINDERVILPIWHNIDKDYIREKSLYLLDIKALSTEMPWNDLLDKILETVRLDIINSHLMLKMGEELHKKAKELPKEEIPISQLNDSAIRHKSMPMHLVIATRLISEVFWDVINAEYNEMVADFAKDLDYNREFIIWSAMANAYIAFIRETHCDFSDTEKKKEVMGLLLDYTTRGELENSHKLVRINEREYIYLIKLFVDNYNHITSMIKKYE